MENKEVQAIGLKLDDAWKKILKNREAMERLLSKGVSYYSPKLVELDEQNFRLAQELHQLENQWNELMQ